MKMAASVPEAVRAELVPQVWKMHIKRVPHREIAATVGISINTVTRWIKLHEKQIAAERAANGHHDLEEFLAVEDAVQNEAWDCVDELDPHQVNKVGLLNIVGQSNERRAKVLGLYVDRVDHTSDGKGLAEIIASVMRPVEVTYVDDGSGDPGREPTPLRKELPGA